VTVSEYWLRSSSCVSLRGLSHKFFVAFLLTELFNICRFKQAPLSASGCASHHIPPHLPRKSLHSHCTLCDIYIFGQYNIVPFCPENVLETELEETLNDKEIYSYPKIYRGTQLVNPDLQVYYTLIFVGSEGGYFNTD